MSIFRKKVQPTADPNISIQTNITDTPSPILRKVRESLWDTQQYKGATEKVSFFEQEETKLKNPEEFDVVELGIAVLTQNEYNLDVFWNTGICTIRLWNIISRNPLASFSSKFDINPEGVIEIKEIDSESLKVFFHLPRFRNLTDHKRRSLRIISNTEMEVHLEFNPELFTHPFSMMITVFFEGIKYKVS